MYQLNSYRSKFTSMWISWITSRMHWQNDRPGHGPITYHAFNPETCWLVIVYTTLISSLNDVGTQSMFRDRCNQRFSGGVFIVTFVIFNDRAKRLTQTLLLLLLSSRRGAVPPVHFLRSRCFRVLRGSRLFIDFHNNHSMGSRIRSHWHWAPSVFCDHVQLACHSIDRYWNSC